MRSTLITSPEEIADYADRWDELRREFGGTIYSSPYLTRIWLDAFQKFASPRMIVVEDGGDLVGVAPLVTYRYNLARIPIKVLALAGEFQDRLRLSTISIMFEPGRKDVLQQMMKEIKGLDWSMLTTINLESTDTTSRYLDAVKSTWNTMDFPAGKMITIGLPAEGDLMEGFEKRGRRNLAKALRALEREQHDVKFNKIPESGIDAAVDVYAKQHIERWEAKGGSYFEHADNIDFLKRALNHALSHSYGFAYELMIDGEVAGQNFGFIDGDKAFAYRLGMNNKFMRFSPGWIVEYNALNDLRGMGITRCIMGVGGERYKHEMGGDEAPLMGIRANRGLASVLTRVALSPTVQKLDKRFGFRQRMLSSNQQVDRTLEG